MIVEDKSTAPVHQKAGAVQNEKGGEDLVQFVTCRIAQEEFALDVLSVQEINRMVEVTRVPKAPYFVEGVINLRGRIIPVLDLRRRFGLPSSDRTDDSRIMVVLVRQRMVGLIVDEVVEVLRVPKLSIEPPPSVGNSAGAEFTQGVGRIEDRLLIVLDLNRLLLPNEQAAMEAMTN
ncbi:MAG: Chemotaxis signal transducer CheW [Nitrospirota bacterium]|jgi:purine-binding chemotaxis protein CheW